MPTATRLGAMLGIKEYPTPTTVGMFDTLLSAPFPFVLTQSFTFLTKAAGQGLLQRQHARMANAGDFAVSQAEELVLALDALTGKPSTRSAVSRFTVRIQPCSITAPRRLRWLPKSGSAAFPRRRSKRSRPPSRAVACDE